VRRRGDPMSPIVWPSAGVQFIDERKPASPNVEAEWYPRSHPNHVHGYQIDGMVYWGASLVAVKGEGIEPALINPSLSVRKPGPSYHGADLYFWPSYAHISPQARGRYLEWLADGRKDPRIEIGFVFLFFYGLERRLLVGDCSDDEQTELIGEIDRLRTIYGKNASFENYSARLLDFLQAGQIEDVCEQASPRVLHKWDQAYSSTLRIGLGYCAANGMPVPASWALAWAESHPEYRQRTPAERCRPEFEELFRIQYARHFPYGCFLHANAPEISFEYQPASASFAGPITAQSDFPDVTLCTEPGTTLKNIAMDCIRQLDAYSRRLGRSAGARESAAALLLLPEPLVRTHPLVVELRCWLDSTLQDSFALADYRILLDKCSLTASDRAITKKDLTLLAQFLERLQVGIEPDPRFGPALPEPDGKIVLFRLGQDRSENATAGYSAASMLLTLGAAVASADGEVTAEEKERLEQQIGTFDLPEAESLRLRAQTQWFLNGGVRFSFVRKLFELNIAS
jgi:hypothetical protein